MTATSPAAPSPLLGMLALAWTVTLRLLVIGHRWLGVVTCLFCALWCASGLVMIYVPYPALSDRDRMTYSEPLDFKAVTVTPDQALAAAGVRAFPSSFKLTMLQDEPIYRLVDGKDRIAVSARDGRKLGGVSPAEAAETVRRLLPGARLGAIKTIERDQWTVAQGFDPHRPLYRVPVEGPEGLVLYVSSRTGEVVNDTHRTERMWNWAGSIPHWIYPTVLRRDNEAWRQVIMWTSGPAILGAATGVWLGILRMRLRKRREQDSISPYRGWMKWHHIAGLIAGLFVVTWLLSGWLSVNPFRWFHREGASAENLARYAGQDAPRFDADPDVLRRLPAGAHEARLTWIGGRPLVVLMGSDLVQTALDARTGQPAGLTDAALFASARALMPDAPVAFARRLTAEDDYWYSHRNNQRRLPVLRIGFDDPAHSWFHIDPATGEILGATNDSGRAYRWWFNLLHDLDVPLLLKHRPVWDVVMWGLSIVGLVVSISGVVIGWRRLVMKIAPDKVRRRPSKLQAARAKAAAGQR